MQCGAAFYSEDFDPIQKKKTLSAPHIRNGAACVAVCCSVLQCVAMCCSVLQCAVRCSVLQCVAVRCSALQCVAVCCSVLQCLAVCCSWAASVTSFMCGIEPLTVTRCTTLQHKGNPSLSHRGCRLCCFCCVGSIWWVAWWSPLTSIRVSFNMCVGLF